MHKSVLLEEVLAYLNLNEQSIVVDMTLGYGGHSSEILKRIKKGFLFAFDQDQDAISFSDSRLKEIGSNYKIIKSNFVNIKTELDGTKVDAILFDLGVSSPQLDQKERGFSFHQDAHLDMRMDKDSKLDADYIVNNYPYEKLLDIFYRYGEEKYSASIAKNIIKNRAIKPITTTLELVELIKASVPEKYKRDKHPARKIFQALRIEVNNELEVFEKALNDSLDMLNVGGRICVITFHSLEDKICKDIFKKNSVVDANLKDIPIIPFEYQPNYKVIKTIEPSNIELDENNRARSAKLRVIEKIKE